MNQTIRDYFTRPHRQVYYPFDLGPAVLLVNGRKCLREDVSIPNKDGKLLSVSFFYRPDDRPHNCLLYLHTHNGSKLEALPLAEKILSLGVNLCLFDFAGYGNSEGSSVTLGCREMWDIECVISHLSEKHEQSKFILWGRSMGAVAALLYLSTKSGMGSGLERSRIVGGIYDSPFHSLEKLTAEIGARSSKLPEVMMTPLVYLVKSSLKEEIDFEELELLEKVRGISVPGIFIASHSDSFVHHSHSEILYKEYGGRKELAYIERDHNQVRR